MYGEDRGNIKRTAGALIRRNWWKALRQHLVSFQKKSFILPTRQASCVRPPLWQ